MMTLTKNQIRLINLIEHHKDNIRDGKYRIAEIESDIRENERYVVAYTEEYNSDVETIA